MIAGSASAVWDRSPPPSCISAIDPGFACCSTFRVMTSAPGIAQSSVSTSQSTTVVVSSAASRVRISGVRDPYGGRNLRRPWLHPPSRSPRRALELGHQVLR